MESQPQRVLVVEGSTAQSQLLAMTLKRIEGLEVVIAADGMEGLKKMAQFRYDLVLTDFNMPLIDGLKFVSLIRGNNGINKGVPIILMITGGEAAAEKKGIALGANSFITKPVDSQKLLDAVGQYLSPVRRQGP